MSSAASEDPKVLSNALPEARLQEVVEAVGQAMMKGEAGVGLKAIDPDGATLKTAIEKAVHDALAISPFKELVKAWKGFGQVMELTGATGPEDGKPRHVAIASHTLKASFKPHIVIELGKLVEVHKLPVPVTFSLKVEGLIITVTDRRIVAITAGRAKPSVTVKVESVTILKEDLPSIDLPWELKLQDEDAEAA
ncbi:hypothetical protein C8N43_3342 [Litoreibacter ponti]|uniref:Uncharacterized protein n=1 Tax=Litoreibacter ponti TaxID=1510457 RepID=A0A2T6BEP5_9RHOB|nr:hypothetical protein [Litoreibacter ponti]PTX54527.1 hypothetical protein C8N43_3342 [Litoreibacter ponti]